MNDRAYLLIRALRFEAENRALREMLRTRRWLNADENMLIVTLRDEERLTWPQIGARMGMSREAARQRYLRAKEQGDGVHT